MNKNDIKLMSESYKLVSEKGIFGAIKPIIKNVSNATATKDVASAPVKANPQDETIEAVMRAWRITPTPENIQNIRSLLTQMQRRSDKAPEDYGAPMHEMQ